MSDFKYCKSYALKQYDGTGTRFRTDGETFQKEVFFPLTADGTAPAAEFVAQMQEKMNLLIEPTVSVAHLVHADAPNETYVVVSGWTNDLSVYERSIASVLNFHA